MSTAKTDYIPRTYLRMSSRARAAGRFGHVAELCSECLTLYTINAGGVCCRCLDEEDGRDLPWVRNVMGKD